jgi:hypothetical protein
MPLVPDGFSELYDTVFTVSDIDVIKNSFGQLIINTENLISREKGKISEKVSYTSSLNGFYHQAKFVELLIANGVNIKQFSSFDDLKNYLDSL